MKLDPDWLSLLAFGATTLMMFGVQWLLTRRWSKLHDATAATPDYRFDPVGQGDLPAATRRWFEEHTPGMLAVRLDPLGDFRLTAGPTGTMTRFFADPEGRAFGSIERHLVLLIRGKTYSFFSVFSDGTYLESAALARPRWLPDPMSVLQFEYVPGASVRELWEHHQQAIARLEQSGERTCLAFGPEQFRELVNYGHRLVGWDLHQKGVRLAPPVPQVAAA